MADLENPYIYIDFMKEKKIAGAENTLQKANELLENVGRQIYFEALTDILGTLVASQRILLSYYRLDLFLKRM